MERRLRRQSADHERLHVRGWRELDLLHLQTEPVVRQPRPRDHRTRIGVRTRDVEQRTALGHRFRVPGGECGELHRDVRGTHLLRQLRRPGVRNRHHRHRVR